MTTKPGLQCRVIFGDEVFRQLSNITPSKGRRERYGLLLGRPTPKGDEYTVQVEGYIEARFLSDDDKEPFTAKTWEALHQEQKDDYPELEIVGWFHTHSGFGVFLTDEESDFHKRYFPEPWQICVIADPNNQDMGMFVWHEEHLKSAPLRHKRDHQAKGVPRIKSSTPRSSLAIALARIGFGFLIGMLAMYLVLGNAPKEDTNLSEEIALALAEESLMQRLGLQLEEIIATEHQQLRESLLQDSETLKQAVALLEGRVDELAIRVDQSAGEDLTNLTNLAEHLETSSVSLAELVAELTASLQEETPVSPVLAAYNLSPETEGENSGVVWTWQFVRRGDNISQLLSQRGLSREWVNAVVELNNLNGANRIYTGDRIMLPALIAQQ